jgi:hypothetical protein
VSNEALGIIPSIKTNKQKKPQQTFIEQLLNVQLFRIIIVLQSSERNTQVEADTKQFYA